MHDGPPIAAGSPGAGVAGEALSGGAQVLNPVLDPVLELLPAASPWPRAAFDTTVIRRAPPVHWKALFFTIGIFSSSFWLVCKPRTQETFLLCGAAWLAYVLEARQSSTLKYLSNLQKGSDVDDFLADARRTEPRISFNAEAYHYETVYTGQGKHRTSSRQRVTTFRSSRPWLAQLAWKDVSGDVAAKWRLHSQARVVKLRFRKALVFKDASTASNFEEDRRSFVYSCRGYDSHLTVRDDLDLDGIEDDGRMLALRDDTTNTLGALWTVHGFWVCTLLGLTQPYRLLFEKKCDVVTIEFAKQCAVEPALGGD
ncbi:hypothetical protein M885DRAFT_564420 [Pelagophyceae sp. CCMP2097]|nr:hypothetical protein M885DRAFT_564420 [Pelagophyceae sp. CCMP2097]